ncbi:MAG: DsrE family protein [Nitrospirales bacterium]|nr:DsrE family protein [Nitrospirales bacterium]
MKLGIFVNTDRHPDDLAGITRAALSKGHEVVIFFMDSGTRLLRVPDIRNLCAEGCVSMSFCDFDAIRFQVDREGISGEIVCGSQYDNALMVNKSDRVIVL